MRPTNWNWEKIVLSAAVFFVAVSIAMYFNLLGGGRWLNRETAQYVWSGTTLLLVALSYWKLTRPAGAERERTIEYDSGLIRPGLRSAPRTDATVDETRRRYNDDAP
jgi:hypothetical protein